MFAATTGVLHLSVFSLAWTLALAISVGIGLWRTQQRAGALVDTALGGLAFGIVGARIEHVLLNWAYFADNLSEALHPNAGGLDWHGAVIGGLIGLALVARWHKLRLPDLLDAFTLALPVLTFAGWWGCAAAVCGWGAEVDTLANYPAFAASETRDVYGLIAPRYNTQVFGLILAVAVLSVSLILIRRGWLKYRRCWLVLALLSLGMFAIGFLRGDPAPMLANLRADQWLDLEVFGGSVVALVRNDRHIASIYRA